MFCVVYLDLQGNYNRLIEQKYKVALNAHTHAENELTVLE